MLKNEVRNVARATNVLTSNLISAATEHPAYRPDNCLNRRQRRFTCTVCSELCEREVFSLKSGETLKWDRCVDCELCVAACPSRCLAPSAGVRRRYGEGSETPAVSFSCREGAREGEKTVRCLAGVPWELLAAIAMRTDLVLYTGACAACEKAAWKERLRENLDALRAFLGEQRYIERVHVLLSGRYEAPAQAEPEETEERTMSRREMFAGMKRSVTKGLVKTAVARLPLPDEAETDGMQYRRMLAQAAAEERKAAAESGETAPDYGVTLPRFTVRCFGCGICEKLCPHQAIAIGQETEGKRLVHITPWKCTGCGLCQKVCPHGGISQLRTLRVPHLEKLALVRVSGASCERCGMPISPENEPKLCPACAAKAGRRR